MVRRGQRRSGSCRVVRRIGCSHRWSSRLSCRCALRAASGRTRRRGYPLLRRPVRTGASGPRRVQQPMVPCAHLDSLGHPSRSHVANQHIARHCSWRSWPCRSLRDVPCSDLPPADETIDTLPAAGIDGDLPTPEAEASPTFFSSSDGYALTLPVGWVGARDEWQCQRCHAGLAHRDRRRLSRMKLAR